MAATTDALRDDELLIERVLNAPVELVYRVWTTPEHLMRWWGPKDFTTAGYEMEFRPGGAYRATIRGPDGARHGMSGVYREITPERRIVMTFAWDEAEGEPFETLVTVTFAPEGRRTRFTFHQTPFQSVESRDSHLGGWTECMDRLQAYAENLA